ncbi:MAG: Histidinol dehydrogenase [Chroococcopsis gigantea SAG 12.99]|jgi:histidinol dehydrogenase|nr:histidinol dehydrogenase [Chlorogloea purpurea SAG 13.99]MDV3001204.1 Histidinol dehydrogenase [Chroococcopsis gigantea SAG 12.99]
MLRIVNQHSEAQTELLRIRARFDDPHLKEHESLVRELIEEIKEKGNGAIIDYASKFHEVTITEARLKVSGSELDAAYQQVSQELLGALKVAREKLTAFHRQRIPKSWVQFQGDDVAIGKRYKPLDSVGIYIPDGSRAHLSLVLLQAIPAVVAGVKNIILVCQPDRDLKIHPAILVAAQEAGVKEIYRVGGPSAIAALAYGTQTIPKVDLITGVGDLYVSLAKKLLIDRVRVNSLHNAAELMILADATANPKQIAFDLLSSAEQSSLASAILLTPGTKLARAVQDEVRQQLPNHPQRILTEKAIAHYGLIVVVESLAQSLKLANSFAPTHLSLLLEEPWDILEQIQHAGTILVGPSTPKIVGDYLGGSALAFGSSLGVENFLATSNVIHHTGDSLKQVSKSLQILAQAEGFSAGGGGLKFRDNEANEQF